MIGNVIILTVLIVMIPAFIIHVNNKHSIATYRLKLCDNKERKTFERAYSLK